MNTPTRCELSYVRLPDFTAYRPFKGLRILHVYKSYGMIWKNFGTYTPKKRIHFFGLSLSI